MLHYVLGGGSRSAVSHGIGELITQERCLRGILADAPTADAPTAEQLKYCECEWALLVQLKLFGLVRLPAAATGDIRKTPPQTIESF